MIIINNIIIIESHAVEKLKPTAEVTEPKYIFNPSLNCIRSVKKYEEGKCISNCLDECEDYMHSNLQKHICFWGYDNPYYGDNINDIPLYRFNLILPFNVTQFIGGICDVLSNKRDHLYCSLDNIKFYKMGIYYPVSVMGYTCITNDSYVNGSMTISTPATISNEGNALITSSHTTINSPYEIDSRPTVTLTIENIGNITKCTTQSGTFRLDYLLMAVYPSNLINYNIFVEIEIKGGRLLPGHDTRCTYRSINTISLIQCNAIVSGEEFNTSYSIEIDCYHCIDMDNYEVQTYLDYNHNQYISNTVTHPCSLNNNNREIMK